MLLLAAFPAFAQPAEADSAPSELPESVRDALATIEDFALNFDQAGFYAVAEFVHTHPRSPGFAETPIEARDWRLLLEQPAAYRGHVVTLTGTVAANKDPYRLPNFPALGLVSQVEMKAPDQPLPATLIFTSPATDLPLNATITVTGYFVMVRQYLDSAGRPRPALLIVAPGPTSVGQRVEPPAPPRPWVWMVVAGVVGLVVAWIWIRRAARVERTDLRTLGARRAAPVSVADDLASWVEEGGPDSGGPAGGDRGGPENSEAGDGDAGDGGANGE